MKISNTFIFTGDHYAVKRLHDDINIFKKNKKQSDLYKIKESKHIRDLVIGNLTLNDNNQYSFGIHFIYKNDNPKALINYFHESQTHISYSCYSSKANMWIVSSQDDILKHELIPHFAAVEIIANYLDYTDRNVITDQYDTVKLEGNRLLINDHPMTKKDVKEFLYSSSINNKPVIQLIEQFIFDFYKSCTNEFEKINHNITDRSNDPSERTSFISLLIVSISIFVIIYVIALLTGTI